MLESKAKEVAEDGGLAKESFSASNSYRLSLRRKTRIGQITPADSEKIYPR
ncbi:Hypothetical protein PHPALM_20634 [Phytophthora palmivora]|uniref:Uncharacterized protein n=1 Tax=Phytophthora palmivora TaxID=4796 RepID=A0A2P4XED9_9STRA|nr:Hypothetical protein PHPALM_20634 [Phytophthora palmivora]